MVAQENRHACDIGAGLADEDASKLGWTASRAARCAASRLESMHSTACPCTYGQSDFAPRPVPAGHSEACFVPRGQEMPVSAGPPAGKQWCESEKPTSSSGQDSLGVAARACRVSADSAPLLPKRPPGETGSRCDGHSRPSSSHQHTWANAGQHRQLKFRGPARR